MAWRRSIAVTPTYDAFGRLTAKTVDMNVSGSNAVRNVLSYTYLNNGPEKTPLVSSMTSAIYQGDEQYSYNTNYAYTYDANGNITKITENGQVYYEYTYDALGQLVQENNRIFNKIYYYAYDSAGNRLSKTEFPYDSSDPNNITTTTFSYQYDGDRLTGYNKGNTQYAVEYDTIGNPVKFTANGSQYVMEWQGRQLTGMGTVISGDSWNEYVTFSYNADGIRTRKQYFNVTHEYMLNGSQIVGETWTDGEGDEYMLIYLYDENGSPIGMKYRSQYYAEGVFDCYFFEKNLQGDIVAVYNASGTLIGAYAYDAWGNVKVTFGSNNHVVTRLNPFRYRGYYYDVETGFYYLQSRYYNPSWGRFLNADGQLNGTLLGFNLYSYCYNNPICFTDYAGNVPSRSVDEDGDGDIDYYVYDYTYTEKFWFFGWGELVYKGSVYIYVGVNNTYFDSDEFKTPKGFNQNTDLLVADLTGNMYAYQAQNINPKFRESILNLLEQYDTDFNTPWNRDVKDLNHEWFWHHVFWRFSKSAQNIDFDNAEANMSGSYFIQKAVDRALSPVKSFWNNLMSVFGG